MEVTRRLRRLREELRRPALAAARLARFLRWRAHRTAYRRRMAAGELVWVPPAEPADVLLSVIMPVYRVAERHLEAAIASVLSQTWPRWELVLVDDASPEPHVGRVLEEATRRDPRVRLVRLPENRGIAGASDAGAAAARGDWLAFLDHDDLLHPRALELVARRIATAPEAGWVFTDEDKVDEEGRHDQPCLKPGFSRHLLLTFNDVCHLRVVRRELFERLGGHRSGLDGAQDYDLALRALAAGARFVHLPGVLYHWRAVRGSMARAAADKPHAHRAALAALERYAGAVPGAVTPRAEVLLEPASFFRLRWRVDPALGVAALGGERIAGARVAERVPLRGDGPEAVVRAVAAAGTPVVALAPEGGLSAEALERLLERLLVPGTALVAARGVWGRRVTASGWWGIEGGGLRDPWRGLLRHDPGYLNLALAPGPRLLPPPTGWVAWRDAVLEAWEADPPALPAWRLPLGWERLGLEVVTVPEVTVPVPPPPAPAAPPGLPWREARWLGELGLATGA